MSKRTITKQVSATICEFCDKEIDTTGGDYCYHHVRSNDGKVIEAYKHKVKHFQFWWERPKGKKLPEYVQYDFHASCFDELMQEFLAKKSTVRVSAPPNSLREEES